jgi:hypothetical protein
MIRALDRVDFKETVTEKMAKLKQRADQTVFQFNAEYRNCLQQLGKSDGHHDPMDISHYLNAVHASIRSGYEYSRNNLRVMVAAQGLSTSAELDTPPLKDVMRACEQVDSNRDRTRSLHGSGPHKPGRTPLPSSSQKKTKESLYCRVHGQGTHSTQQCRALKSQTDIRSPNRTTHKPHGQAGVKPTPHPSPAATSRVVTCFKCKKVGHTANHCTWKPANGQPGAPASNTTTGTASQSAATPNPWNRTIKSATIRKIAAKSASTVMKKLLNLQSPQPKPTDGNTQQRQATRPAGTARQH